MRKKVVVAMLLPVKNHIYPVFLHQSSRLGGETSNLSYVGQIGRIGQLWSYVRRIGRVGQFMGPGLIQVTLALWVPSRLKFKINLNHGLKQT